MSDRKYRAAMQTAYGLGIFVGLLFVTSVVTAVTLDPPQSSGYGISERTIAVASAGPMASAGIGN